jgi:hypothetical protein
MSTQAHHLTPFDERARRITFGAFGIPQVVAAKLRAQIERELFAAAVEAVIGVKKGDLYICLCCGSLFRVGGGDGPGEFPGSRRPGRGKRRDAVYCSVNCRVAACKARRRGSRGNA